MDRISNLIPKVLATRGLAGEGHAAHVVFQAQQWILEKHPHLEGYFKVERLKDGELRIACTHSVALQECQQFLHDLEAYLRNECGHSDLSAIRVVRSDNQNAPQKSEKSE